MIYDLLAKFYDKVNGHIDYSVWADFIERVAAENMTERPELVLDLGCGTGRMTLELARRGYDMIGVDSSAEMLDVARNEAEAKDLSDKVLLLLQDMCDFELYGTVELCVSTLDCINHLTDNESLDKCFSLVHNYLSPDGLFVFDVNGKYKFENIYSDRPYVIEDGDDMLVWQNFYNPKTKICDFLISEFSLLDDGTYERQDEYGREKMYTLRTLSSHLKKSGFELIGAYSDFDKTVATDNDERIYLVARCKK